MLIIDVLNAEPAGSNDSVSGLARRIWRMEQDAIRFSLRELGIPLVRWDGRQSLDEPLAPYTRRVMVMRTDDRAHPNRQPAGRGRCLAAACVAWSALPLRHGALAAVLLAVRSPARCSAWPGSRSAPRPARRPRT